MGYYTSYTLDVQNLSQEDTDKLVQILKDRNLFEIFDEPYQIEYLLEFPSSDVAKWYDHDENMCEISRLFPNAVFKLSGFGEAAGDIWDTYYQNGEFEYCEWEPTKPKSIIWKTNGGSDGDKS